MKAPNYIALRLRAYASASAASFLAVAQGITGNHFLADKARALAIRRRAEADFFGSLPFIS